MTPEEARAIAEDVVHNLLGIDRTGHSLSRVTCRGNISYKMVGALVGDAIIQGSRYILVDANKVSSVAGRKPLWR